MALLRHLSDIPLAGASLFLNVDNITFLFPRAWLLLWVFIFLIPFAIRFFGHCLKTARIMEARPPRLRIFFSIIALLAALFFLIVTIAEPYSVTVTAKPVYKDEVIDVSIDISLSFLAADVAPSRIDKVKSELTAAMLKLNKNGITMLCLGAFTIVYERLLECTEDTVNFENTLNSINLSSAPDKGTDLVAALPYDYDFMRKEVISPKTRITLFIITDGGSGICLDKTIKQFYALKPDWDEKNLEAAIIKLRKDNIRVIPIGVGGNKPVEVRTLDSEGRPVAVTTPSCEFLYTILDEKIIDKMAEWGGDKNRKFILRNNTSLGDFIEKTVLSSREVSHFVAQENRKPLWRYPLALAIIFGFFGSGSLSFIERILRRFLRRK